MYIYIDESGDLNFMDSKQRITEVLGGLIVPDNLQYRIDRLIIRLDKSTDISQERKCNAWSNCR